MCNSPCFYAENGTGGETGTMGISSPYPRPGPEALDPTWGTNDAEDRKAWLRVMRLAKTLLIIV